MKLLLLLTIAALALGHANGLCDSNSGLLTQAMSGGTTISLDATGTSATGPASTQIYNQLTTVSLKLTTSAHMNAATRILGYNGQIDAKHRTVINLAVDAYNVLRFTPPVSSVLLKMNYSPDDFPSTSYPVMTVLDSNDNEVTCYNIETLAPIRTPNGTNEYAWRGVTSANKISQLKFSGALLTYWDVTFFTAPATTPQVLVNGDGPAAGPGASSTATSTTVALSVVSASTAIVACLI